MSRSKSRLSSVDSTRLSNVKERVPFLADAVSDGDEVYEAEDEEEARNFLDALDQHPTDTEASRSIVGYTPNHSVDSFHPPERTSTPVYTRSRQHSTRSTTSPLPPYTPSDASHLTPAKSQPLLSSRSSTLPMKLRVSREEEVRAAEEVEAVLLEMEGRAISFYQTGLVGRCWETWLRQADWVLTTSAQVQKARNNILLRQCLQRWQELHQHHLDLPGTADHHRVHTLMSSHLANWRRVLKARQLRRKEQEVKLRTEQRPVTNCFQRWRSAKESVQRERWEQEMSSREANLHEKRDMKVKALAFAKWRTRHLTNQAVALHDLRLLQSTLRDWRCRAAQSRTLRQTLAAYQEDRDAEIVESAWAEWRRRTVSERSAGTIQRLVDTRLLRNSLSTWRHRRHDRQKARQFDQRRVLGAALHKWEEVTCGVKVLGGAAHRYRLQRDAELVRTAFSTWAATERGRLLERVRTTRQLRTAFLTWRWRQEQLKAKEAEAQVFHSNADKRLKQVTLTKMRGAIARRTAAAAKADKVQRLLLLRRPFIRWQSAAGRVDVNSTRAEVARIFFVQRSVIACWRDRLAGRRQQAWEEQKKLRAIRQCFESWRQATLKSQQLTASYYILLNKTSKRLTAAALGQWTNRIVEIKSREFDVAQMREVKLQRSAFDLWTQACVRRGESLSLMQSFMDVKQDDAIHALLVKWHHLAVRAKDRRLRAEKREEDCKERLLGKAFDKWRSVLKERALAPQLAAVMLRHEDALLFRVFDTWKARSQRLPAIAFESKRVKLLAWKRWTEALPRKRQAREAAAAESVRLLSQSLNTWKDRFHSRIAHRAAARHRNVTGLAGATRFRPTSASPLPYAVPTRSRPGSISPSLGTPSAYRRRPHPIVTSPVPQQDSFAPTHARLRSELASSTSRLPSPPTSRKGSDLYQELAGKVVSRSGK